MFSRSLLARSGILRPSRVYSRLLSSLHEPARHAASSYTNLRRFSAAPAFREESQPDPPAPLTPSGTCYIKNLPYQLTAEQIKDVFSEFGKIVNVKLLTSETGLPKGAGFVRFDSVAEAARFVEEHLADPIFLLDRQLYVRHAERPLMEPKAIEPSDTLMVFHVEGRSYAEVRLMFGDYAGEILEVRVGKKDSVRGCAFVRFADVDVAKEAMDAFKSRNEDGRIAYARHKPSYNRDPATLTNLASRLSQRRVE